MDEYISDFDKSEVVFDADISFVADVFEVVVNFFEVFAEGSVRIDDGQLGCFPRNFSSCSVEIPEVFGDQEVVIFDFSVVVGGRNIEVGGSSVVIIVNSVSFGGGGFPGAVICVGIEGADYIGPGVFETLD